jgi:hypothetical protein
LSNGSKEELKLWITIVVSGNGKTIRQKDILFHLATDASMEGWVCYVADIVNNMHRVDGVKNSVCNILLIIWSFFHLLFFAILIFLSL